MRQRYNNKKRPKPKENQLGILKIYAFCRRPRVQESAAGVTYLSMRMHPKNCGIFPLNVATTLLSGSRKAQLEYISYIVTVVVEATC